MKNDQLTILRGTLDVLVLRAVSWQPLHGFEISLWLEERSGGALDIDDSALYQSLHRLEAESSWSANGACRRTTAARATTSSPTRVARTSAPRARNGVLRQDDHQPSHRRGQAAVEDDDALDHSGTGFAPACGELFVTRASYPRRSQSDMEAELRAHIDARVEYLVARGHAPEAARAEAKRRFGDIDATLEILQTSAADRERRLTLRDKVWRSAARRAIRPSRTRSKSRLHGWRRRDARPRPRASTRPCFESPIACCCARPAASPIHATLRRVAP